MWAEQAGKQEDQDPSDLEGLTLEIWHGHCRRPCDRNSFSDGQGLKFKGTGMLSALGLSRERRCKKEGWKQQK